MTTTATSALRRRFIQGLLVGSMLSTASFGAGQAWTRYSDSLNQSVVIAREERPAERAARLLGETAFSLEAMFHRELTAADAPALLNGALSAIDPHGGYVAPDFVRALAGDTPEDAPFRIGVLGVPLANSFVVETTAPGGPADEAGLRPGDRIVGIGGADMGASTGQEVFDALLVAVESAAGKGVLLEVLRGMETITLEMFPKRLAPFFAYNLGRKEGVEHVVVTAFYPGAAKSVQNILSQAVEEGAQGVVLDVRGNAGGRVDEMLEMLGLFAPKGTLAYVRDARGQAGEEARTRTEPLFEGVRLAVLIDGDTASSSEMLAAAVQAHRLGLVVGERSYGKGSIQTVYPVDPEGGALKMTIGFYRDPLGRRIDGVGVEPDVEAPVETEGDRPLFGEPDAGFAAAAAWITSQEDIPVPVVRRPELTLNTTAQ